jgi:hypothetical protein
MQVIKALTNVQASVLASFKQLLFLIATCLLPLNPLGEQIEEQELLE